MICSSRYRRLYAAPLPLILLLLLLPTMLLGLPDCCLAKINELAPSSLWPPPHDPAHLGVSLRRADRPTDRLTALPPVSDCRGNSPSAP